MIVCLTDSVGVTLPPSGIQSSFWTSAHLQQQQQQQQVTAGSITHGADWRGKNSFLLIFRNMSKPGDLEVNFFPQVLIKCLNRKPSIRAAQGFHRSLSCAGCLEKFPPLRSMLLCLLLNTAVIQYVLRPGQESLLLFFSLCMFSPVFCLSSPHWQRTEARRRICHLTFMSLPVCQCCFLTAAPVEPHATLYIPSPVHSLTHPHPQHYILHASFPRAQE